MKKIIVNLSNKVLLFICTVCFILNVNICNTYAYNNSLSASVSSDIVSAYGDYTIAYDSNSYYVNAAAYNSTYNFYMFFYDNVLYVCVDNNSVLPQYDNLFWYQPSSGSGGAFSGRSFNQNNTTYNLKYASAYLVYQNYNIPVFNSLNEGLSAVRSYIDNPPTNVKYPYTFQNGYLFVYDLGSSDAMYSFDLTSKSEEYSNLGDYPFPDTNQSYWFSNSLPEIDETSIPDSSATIIHWLKGNKQNIFGQTQDMVATISGTSTNRYLYIYNPPAHYKWVGSSNPTASETINYPVTINGVSIGDNFYIYDSVARLADYNQGGKVQGTVGEVGFGSVASDGAITVTTSDGAIYNQVSGGSTDITGANGGSIAENINGLKQTLDDFVNQFIQLLSAPISHIQQLIQSSHQFFDVFSQLFEWLPSELSSVIISGLIIMVVIGVIKMLL